MGETMNRKGSLLVLLMALAAFARAGYAQGTFPRDGNEGLAMRLHDWYRQSQARLAELESSRTKVKGFISEVAPASTMVGTAIAPEDVVRLGEIDEDIARERERCRRLETAWEKNRSAPPTTARSFAGRYGPLSDSGQRSVDARYDKIEYAIRNFPFETPAPANERGSSLFDGSWHTERQHDGCCSYSAREDVTFSTDARGVTSANNGSFLRVSRGKATGASLVLDYGIENAIASGHATLTLAVDGRSFTGTFSDKTGHHGTLRGSR